MPLLMIRQHFGTNVSHSIIMCDDPRPATELGKEIARVEVPEAVARLPLRVLARLFPAVIEGETVSGPSVATVEAGLRKGARRARRRGETGAPASGPENGSTASLKWTRPPFNGKAWQ